MRIAVLGAGAIGAYVGAALARGGAEVHLIARGENLEALRRDGVRVRSERGDFDAHPPATDDSNEIGPVDFVFLGLKANSYASCGPLLEPLLHEETAVVAGQNGIPWWYFHKLEGPYAGTPHRGRGPRWGSVARDPTRAGDRLRRLRRHGARRARRGPAPRGDALLDRRAGRLDLRALPAFSEAMVAGGLKCPVEERLRDEIWVKLMGNVAFNPLSVLTRATLAEMCRQASTRALVTSIMEEALEIAAALGAEPSVSIEQRLEGAEKVGDHKPSTLQDLEAGKPLELAAIVDSVVELADLTGVHGAEPAGRLGSERPTGGDARTPLTAAPPARAA